MNTKIAYIVHSEKRKMSRRSQNFNTELPFGSTRLPDGNIQLLDGRIILPNGNIKLLDGTEQSYVHPVSEAVPSSQPSSEISQLLTAMT